MAKGKRSRGDDGWKIVLGQYLDDFLEFFFPHISAEIERGHYDFCDKELQSLSRRARTGKRIADSLVKVYLRDGGEKWLLIHIEVQGKAEKRFEERLFIYSYRIFDRYKRDVVTLAVLTDDKKDYRPSSFEMGRWGCRHCFEFPSVKLYDYKERIDELEKSSNPFAVVVLAHLRHSETKRKKRERLFWKLSLAKDLESKGFGQNMRGDLNLFIDWLLALPEELEKEYIEEMKKFEEGKEMAYVSSAERLGMKKGFEKGMEKGREEGLQEANLIHAREMKALNVDREIIKKVTGIDIDTI
ncbi:MAG: cytosolic protein [Candidatus Xenobiia bacterium LiM19]